MANVEEFLRLPCHTLAFACVALGLAGCRVTESIGTDCEVRGHVALISVRGWTDSAIEVFDEAGKQLGSVSPAWRDDPHPAIRDEVSGQEITDWVEKVRTAPVMVPECDL